MKVNSENTNINLRHLRAIHMIWHEGSFARAADRLGVVPSALSETVRQLEEVAGGALFDRNQRPARPTELGLSFLEETGPVIARFDQALGQLRAHAGLLQGSLHIGASPSAIAGLVSPALARFRQDFPAIAITLHDDIAEQLAAKVVSGALDLAIAGRAHHSSDLLQDEITRDRFGLACRFDHPLTRQAQVRVADIDPGQLVHLDGRTGSAALLAGSGQLPPAYLAGRLNSHSTIGQLCLIRSGLGVGLLPQNAVTLFNDPQIAFLPVADLQVWRSLYVLRPALRGLSPAASRFCDYLPAPS